MTTMRIRFLASVVIALGVLAMAPVRKATAAEYCGETCISCRCSAGGNYVCCLWVDGIFVSCSNYGQGYC